MIHPTVDQRTLLHILAAVQEGECTKRRALECIEAALAGNFTDDWLPQPEGYFGEDEMPTDVVKQLRANAGVTLPREPSAATIERMCAALTTSRWPQDFGVMAQQIRRAQARRAYAEALGGIGDSPQQAPIAKDERKLASVHEQGSKRAW